MTVGKDVSSLFPGELQWTDAGCSCGPTPLRATLPFHTCRLPSVHASFICLADVVNCMQTEDMELKKLVYLYLINYAKTQPDLAIMAVNTFVKVGPPLRISIKTLILICWRLFHGLF